MAGVHADVASSGAGGVKSDHPSPEHEAKEHSSDASMVGTGRFRKPPRLSWYFGQCFGEKDPDEEFQDADVLSAVEFDTTGEFLATGDKGGRIVLFKRADVGKASTGGASSAIENAGQAADTGGSDGSPGYGNLQYNFYSEFQSHEAEFDYLKSLEIEEKINKICWCRPAGSARFLLSTNDKTIKLWRIQERAVRHVEELNVKAGPHGGRLPVDSIAMPSLSSPDPQVIAIPKRVYANAHTYHINSVASNSDGEHFLSADDLRINLWSYEHAKLSFNIVDMKPDNMEDLTEVITAARFHPTECNQLLYSSSRGVIRVADMRRSALCDDAKAIEIQPDEGQKSYYSEIIASISDVRFVPDGRHIVARDYLTIRLFDVRKPSTAVQVIPVHEKLRAKLGDLYENDSIFDKFEVGASPHSSHFVTGSYSNGLHVFDTTRSTDTMIRLDQHRARTPSVEPIARVGQSVRGAHEPEDYARKVLHYSWHPVEDTLAIAGVNNLFIYNARRNDGSVSGEAIGAGGRQSVTGGGGGSGGTGGGSGYYDKASAASPHGAGGGMAGGGGT